MRICHISDTHMTHKGLSLRGGDVLVHTGDSLAHGTLEELRVFLAWMEKQPFKEKILIAGNHDACLEGGMILESSIHYLQDSGVAIEGITFYGTPWVPRFGNWSFMKDRGTIDWSNVPPGTNVLLTHGPPYGHGDLVNNRHAGDLGLLRRCAELKELRYALFGHIHEGHGSTRSDEIPGVRFINSSICDGGKPTYFDY